MQMSFVSTLKTVFLTFLVTGFAMQVFVPHSGQQHPSLAKVSAV
jgi:hypothetical protein